MWSDVAWHGASSRVATSPTERASNHSVCKTWVPDMPHLPLEALYLNLVFCTMLLLLVLILSYRASRGATNRSGIKFHRSALISSQSFLTLLFAVDRVGWSALLVGVTCAAHHNASNQHPFSDLDGRIAFLSNRLGTVVFFILTGLLLAKVGDVIVVGWKTSRRLWLAFKFVAAVLCAAAVALAVAAPRLEPHRMLSLANLLTACASGLAALAIAAIAIRYHGMGAPAVLQRFARARCAIHFVGLLALICFVQHAIPTDVLAELLSSYGLCDGGDGGAHLEWLMLLHSHWLAELVPLATLLLLTHSLDRLHLVGTDAFGSGSISEVRAAKPLPCRCHATAPCNDSHATSATHGFAAPRLTPAHPGSCSSPVARLPLSSSTSNDQERFDSFLVGPSCQSDGYGVNACRPPWSSRLATLSGRGGSGRLSPTSSTLDLLGPGGGEAAAAAAAAAAATAAVAAVDRGCFRRRTRLLRVVCRRWCLRRHPASSGRCQ